MLSFWRKRWTMTTRYPDGEPIVVSGPWRTRYYAALVRRETINELVARGHSDMLVTIERTDW